MTHDLREARLREALLHDQWSILVEKDDRTSPEEYPDMCLITREEVAAIIDAALSSRGDEAKKIDDVSASVADVLRSFHRNSCYPEALDGEVDDTTKTMLAVARDSVATWMIAHSYPTGHGDTLDDLLHELVGYAKERARSAASGDLRERIALRRTVLDLLNNVAPAVENLACNQEQADMDGCMVKVSRQALDEVLAAVNDVAMQAATSGWLAGGDEAKKSEGGKKETIMTEDQIKHMVNRFLGWTLPENFNPDGGVSFKRLENRYHHPEAPPFYPMPTGTNLFDAMQADAMVRYMIDGMPTPSDPPAGRREIVAQIHTECPFRLCDPRLSELHNALIKSLILYGHANQHHWFDPTTQSLIVCTNPPCKCYIEAKSLGQEDENHD